MVNIFSLDHCLKQNKIFPLTIKTNLKLVALSEHRKEIINSPTPDPSVRCEIQRDFSFAFLCFLPKSFFFQFL